MRLLRNVGISLCAPAAALTLLVSAPGALADAGFVKSWGLGVSTGAQQFESCTTSCRTGLTFGDAGALAYPEAVAFSATGNVLVGDFGLNRIDVFSADGSFVRAFGGAVGGAGVQTCTTSCVHGSFGGGAGELASPWGVAADTSGNVVVGEFTNHRVSVFTESGVFVRTFGWGVSTGANALQVCTSGCRAGLAGSGAGQLNKPRGVALDGTGHVLVVDYLNNRVQEFTPAGAYVRSFGATGTGAGQIREPDGIGVGPSGNVFVSDSMNNRVDVFSPTGAFVRSFGWGVNTGSLLLETCTSACRAGTAGSGTGQLNAPAGLAVDAAGRVLVSDNLNSRVNVYTESGAFVRSIGSAGSGAGQIAGASGPAVDGAGRAFVADTYNHRIDAFRYLFPTIALDQSGLSFGAQTTGTTGSSMTVTLTNGGDADLSLDDPAITGADSDQFSRPAGTAGGTCDTATPIAPALSCTVKLVFAPTTRGAKSATLAVSGDTLAGSDSVALTGTGQGPVVSFDRGAASFGGQATGVASSPMSVTVSNAGETALSLSAIAIVGADSAQFSRAAGPAAGTCDTSAPIAAGASCTVGLVFTPASDGLKSASLSLSSDAPAGVASLPLSGTGAWPAMAVDQAALAFGDEPVNSTYGVRTLTVTNTSVAQLMLTSVALAGPDASDFWGVNDGAIGHCSGSTVLAAGESCAILVIFTPRTAGAKTASVSVAGNASPTATVVPLSGTGIQTFAGTPPEFVVVPPASFEVAPSSPDVTASPTRPSLAKAGAPSAKARGTGVRVDPAIVITCPTGIVRCTSKLTATAQVPVTGHKGRMKKLVVGRASITTREGATARIVFSLTSQGGRTLRKLGRLRLSVVAVTTGANGATARLSATVAVKRPGKRKA